MVLQKIHLQAIEDIPQWSCVTASGELADNTNPAHENHVIGVTDGKMMNGLWGDVTISGTLFNLDWSWTPGGQIYLGATVLTQTPPGGGFMLRVGWALTPQSMLVQLAAV